MKSQMVHVCFKWGGLYVSTEQQFDEVWPCSLADRVQYGVWVLFPSVLHYSQNIIFNFGLSSSKCFSYMCNCSLSSSSSFVMNVWLSWPVIICNFDYEEFVECGECGLEFCWICLM